jgi:hypothetical protein
MNISKGTGPKILAIAIYVAALAAAPTLLNGTLAQTESANTNTTTTTAATAAAKGGSANSILISSSGKNYQCTSTGTATNPPTLGIHLSASKEGGTLKGQWHIIGTEFGEKKGTITGGTLDKTKYELKGRESIDTLCGGNVPKEVTISGNCGTNQRINFRIIDGSHEEFTGRAHCSELLF